MNRELLLEKHNQILDYLLEYQNSHPSFLFSPRKNNTQDKLESGFWFQGSDSYIFVPLYKRGCSNNKTKTIGFVFTESAQYIDIVFNKVEDISDYELSFYEEVLKYLKDSTQFINIKKTNRNQYIHYFKSNDLYKNLEFFVSVFKDKVDELLTKFNLNNLYKIEREEFNKRIERITKIKEQGNFLLNNENNIEEAIDFFISELEINEENRTRVGLQFKTPSRNKIFYVYTNLNRTIMTKPLDGIEQFSQPTSVLKKYLKTGEISKDNDKSYIIPIAEYIKEKFLINNEDIRLGINKMKTKNIMLYGAPGVGKTYNYQKLITMIEKGFSEKEIFKSIDDNEKTELNSDEFKKIKDEKRIEFVTFHQSYSYEDFIEGFRPQEDGPIKLEKGVFQKIVENANESDKNFYIVIDEINRGNISKIFGELITLIEEDKRDSYEVTLPYSKEKFKVPSNLYIIATMNSTDKSIATIDIALRRRFTFLKMQPNPNLVKNESARNLMESLNQYIKKTLGEDYQLGHSYFMKVENEEDLEFVKEYKIKPLLEEYFYSEEKSVEEILKEIESKDSAREGS